MTFSKIHFRTLLVGIIGIFCVSIFGGMSAYIGYTNASIQEEEFSKEEGVLGNNHDTILAKLEELQFQNAILEKRIHVVEKELYSCKQH